MSDKQKILIVDDNQENLTALRRVLSDLDAEIIEAHSGKVALAATSAHEFALAILDVNMSQMNGFELAERLRGDDKTKALPIMFLTASYADEQHQFRGYESGAIDYMTKPYVAGILCGKVRGFLELDLHKRELLRHKEQLESLVAERTRDLAERVKELGCLYKVSQLVADFAGPIDEGLAAAVDMIPPGWTYPEIARVRITLAGQEFRSPGFKKTPWMQSADILVNGKKQGTVELCYLEQRPPLAEGPFYAEERDLINDIARQLGVMIENKRAAELLRLRAQISKIFLTVSSDNDMFADVLDIVLDSMESEFGIFGYISAAGDLVVPSMTRHIWEKCQAKDKSIVFPRAGWGQAIWAEAIRQKKTLCKNRPSVNIPKGHVPIARSLHVPIIAKDEVIGLFQVANKKTDYTDDDIERLEMIAHVIAPILAARLQRNSLDAERHRNIATLQAATDYTSNIIESLSDILFVIDSKGVVQTMNRAGLALLGFDQEELIGKSTSNIFLKEEEEETANSPLAETPLLKGKRLSRLLKEGAVHDLEVSFLTKRGERIPMSFDGSVMKGPDGKLTAVVCIAKDLREKKRIEVELEASNHRFLQSQKLEAVGQLAGGIAHDFNNLLTAILSYSGFLKDALPPGDPKLEDVAEIRKAGERAAALTRQLLAFSRKQVMHPKALDLNEVIEDVQKLLRRTIPEHIELSSRLASSLGRITADESQLGQVLVNLAVNAGDAMPNGGRLLIETADIEFTEPVSHEGVLIPAGSYVMLAVTDNGPGIPPEVRKRMFEPFFTTKEVGKGTGLGLSTVYGIIKQSGGYITVYSEAGKGATFRIYLPATQQPPASAADRGETLESLRGAETILVVEDDAAVRKTSLRILRNLGYTLLEASNGIEALKVSNDFKDPIHLLLTDVIMPELDGVELARRMKTTRPRTKVIFTSGYPGEALPDHKQFVPGENFLNKPFSPTELARLARKILNKTSA